MMDLGNAFERPLAAIWRSRAFREVRRKFVAGQPVHAVCLDCDKREQSVRTLERVRRRYWWAGP